MQISQQNGRGSQTAIQVFDKGTRMFPDISPRRNHAWYDKYDAEFCDADPALYQHRNNYSYQGCEAVETGL